jgi:hypothetical protein
MHVTVGRAALCRRTKISVDADERTILHGSHPFLEMGFDAGEAE